jgi:putative endonuclease
LYIGVTNSLQKRLKQHRNGEGSSFVKAYGVHRLVYVESYERAEEAITREKQLKRWKRDWKIELIERDNPEWRDLSDLLVRPLCAKLGPGATGPCFRRDDIGGGGACNPDG